MRFPICFLIYLLQPSIQGILKKFCLFPLYCFLNNCIVIKIKNNFLLYLATNIILSFNQMFKCKDGVKMHVCT